MTKKQKTREEGKLPIAEVRKDYAKIKRLVDEGSKCLMCDKQRHAYYFYNNMNPEFKSVYSQICKDCAWKIAHNTGDDGVDHEPTKESVRHALRYLDRPYLERVWDAAVGAVNNETSKRKKQDVWTAYMVIIQMKEYEDKTYLDSDGIESKLATTIATKEEPKADTIKDMDMSEDMKKLFEANKKTVMRFTGYEVFENEPINEQPLLYAKLASYCDDSTRDDGFKMEGAIQIVQIDSEVNAITDEMSRLKRNLSEDGAIATLKQLTAVKKDLIASSLQLAKENGISITNATNKSKGAGTLSGIIKEMNEMNLDAIEVNTFDIETSAAMSDVMAKSFENQMKQINPDANDWEREVHHQAEVMFNLQSERDKAVEYCRRLRKENKELKDFLQERGIINEALEVIDE